MGKMDNYYTVLVEKPKGKKPVARAARRLGIILKLTLFHAAKALNLKPSD
jgi:hypothetical protein